VFLGKYKTGRLLTLVEELFKQDAGYHTAVINTMIIHNTWSLCSWPYSYAQINCRKYLRSKVFHQNISSLTFFNKRNTCTDYEHVHWYVLVSALAWEKYRRNKYTPICMGTEYIFISFPFYALTNWHND